MITSAYLGSTNLMTGNFFLTAIRNLAWPGVSVNAAGKGTFAGTKLGISKPQNFHFVMEFTIFGSSFSDLANQRNAFEAALDQILQNPPVTLTLTLANGTVVTADCRSVIVTGDVDAESPQIGSFLVEIQTEYPYLLEQTIHNTTVNIATGGGISIPMGIPLNFANGGNNSVILNNLGNMIAYPTFTLYGPLNFASLVNVTTNQILNMSYNLPAGQTITVNMFNRTCVLNDGTNMRQYFTGNFFTFLAGNNLINLSSSPNTQLGYAIASWQGHFIGI